MPSSKENRGAKSRLRLRTFQVLVLALLIVLWHVLTSPTLLPPIYFTEANQAAFFFGEPIQVFARLWRWFASGEIYEHLWVTLVETLLAFLIGTVSGVVIGLWLALSPTASAILDPYIKAVNAMPRVILAPIFFVWFGLGIASKVALGVTLVFFIVFFNVYQGVREVSAVAFVGAVVGEYLGSAKGVGYLIHQAEGFFDMNTVVAGILLLTAFALLLDWAVGLAEKRLMVWQPRSVETERA